MSRNDLNRQGSHVAKLSFSFSTEMTITQRDAAIVEMDVRAET